MSKLKRALYQPYKWLVFMPFLVITTVVFGSASVLLSYVVNTRIASYLTGAIWARLNGWATPIRLTVRGGEHVQDGQSYVIVSNHQSQCDILVLYGWLGLDFKWVMKQELRKIPVLGLACDRLGHIYVDRSNHKAAIASINAAKDRIRNGTCVIFFPEGTRSRSGVMGPFKKGAFKLAYDLGLPLLPVTILGTRDILPPDTLDLMPGRAELVIHPPIHMSDLGTKPVIEAMALTRRILQDSLDEYAQRHPAQGD